jgi:hypothetical protein
MVDRCGSYGSFGEERLYIYRLNTYNDETP